MSPAGLSPSSLFTSPSAFTAARVRLARRHRSEMPAPAASKTPLWSDVAGECQDRPDQKSLLCRWIGISRHYDPSQNAGR
jgi:hypothetical protein